MKRKGNFGGIFAMALILVLTLVLSVGSVSAAEPTIVDSGNCGKDGNNVTWTLDSAGLLTISGTGEMADYESKTDSASGEEITTAPWGNQAKTAVTGDGVTGIGAAAFYGCSGLTSVTIKAKQYRCRRPEAYGINCSRAFSPRKFTDDSIDANHCFPLTGGTRTPICSEVGKIKTMWCPF